MNERARGESRGPSRSGLVRLFKAQALQGDRSLKRLLQRALPSRGSVRECVVDAGLPKLFSGKGLVFG